MKITKQNIEFNYINLDSRTDKKAHIQNELNKYDITAKRFSACLPNDNYKNWSIVGNVPGQRGCFLSHIKLISEYNNEDKILGIFEDDVVLCEDFNERLEYIEKNFNKDWDIFYFTSFYHLNNDPKKWKSVEFEFTDVKYINRVYSSFCTHAYLVNPKSINKILDLCMKNLNNTYAIDHLYLLIQPELNCYSFTPGMATQLAGTNDINNHHKDQSVFKTIVGDHYYVNNLKEFNYDSFFKNNITMKYDRYNFRNEHFNYELFINSYFKNIYKFDPNNVVVQPHDYTATLDLARRCGKDKLIIDVGANHGLFAIPCALYGYDVVGFEPVATNIETLELSRNYNNCNNLTIVNAALFNETKESVIYVPNCSDNSSLNPNVAIANMSDKQYVEEKISCLKFDDWGNNELKNRIGFIKIDVQGFEYPVIQGMYEFLSKAKDLYIFLEWDDKLTNGAGYSLTLLYQELIHLGFQEQPCFNHNDKLFYKS